MPIKDVPSPDALMWPTINALKELGGSASNEELLNKTIELEQYTDKISAALHTDGRQTRLNYNLAWARTFLKSGEAIENSMRGVWSITPKGERLNKADAKTVYQNYLTSIKNKEKYQQKTLPIKPQDSSNSADTNNWKDELLGEIRKLSPSDFERLSQRLLRESGFVKVQVTGKSGDGGIDGTGVLRINLLSFQVLFQCKRYKGSVGPGEIRDFRGAMMGRSDKGLFITTGTFTTEARREATRDGAPAIDLIDGNSLCDLMKDLELGVKLKTISRVIVKIDQDWFASF